MNLRQTAYYWDEELRDQANTGGANYWHTYTAEICDQLGLKAVQLQRPDWLAEMAQTTVLILPDLPDSYLSEAEMAALREWVEAGGC